MGLKAVICLPMPRRKQGQGISPRDATPHLCPPGWAGVLPSPQPCQPQDEPVLPSEGLLELCWVPAGRGALHKESQRCRALPPPSPG